MSRRHPDRDRVGGAVGAGSRIESEGPSVAAARDSPDPRVRTLANRVTELEEELERTERRHRDVVQRYERLLADAREGPPPNQGTECTEEPGRQRGLLGRLRDLL